MIRILLFSVIVLSLFGCEYSEQNSCTIQIGDDLNPDQIRLTYSDPLSNKYIDLADTIRVNKTGLCMDVAISEPFYAYLIVNDSIYWPIYLAPGYTLTLSNLIQPWNPNTGEKVDIGGKGAEVNGAISQVRQILRNNENPYFFELEEDQFRKRIDTIIAQTTPVTSQLERYDQQVVESYISSHICLQKFNYTLTHYNLYDSIADIPDFILDGLEELVENELAQKLLPGSHSVSVRMFYMIQFQSKTWKSEYANNDSMKTQLVALIHERIKNSELPTLLKDHAIALNIYDDLVSNGVSSVNRELALDYFPEMDNYYLLIKKKIDELQFLSPGQKAPEIFGLDQEGDSVPINNLPGKLTYIDIWATWCRPCISSFPDMARLIKEYSGRGVNFVLISTDRKNRWESFLETDSLLTNAIHLQALDRKKLRQDYKMWGIPRYVLLDGNGNIIDAYAPSPGSNALRKIIDKHL